MAVILRTFLDRMCIKGDTNRSEIRIGHLVILQTMLVSSLLSRVTSLF